jgi:hypothetical protein
MPLFRIYVVALAALTVAGCASQPTVRCEADLSPEGYDLVLRTVPGARVDYRVGKDQKTLTTATGVEKIATSADEVEILRCVQDLPKT